MAGETFATMQGKSELRSGEALLREAQKGQALSDLTFRQRVDGYKMAGRAFSSEADTAFKYRRNELDFEHLEIGVNSLRNSISAFFQGARYAERAGEAADSRILYREGLEVGYRLLAISKAEYMGNIRSLDSEAHQNKVDVPTRILNSAAEGIIETAKIAAEKLRDPRAFELYDGAEAVYLRAISFLDGGINQKARIGFLHDIKDIMEGRAVAVRLFVEDALKMLPRT